MDIDNAEQIGIQLWEVLIHTDAPNNPYYQSLIIGSKNFFDLAKWLELEIKTNFQLIQTLSRLVNLMRLDRK